MKILSRAALAVAFICLQALFVPAHAQAQAKTTADVTVTDAWIRATVPTQKATGAFMHLQSAAGTRIVDVKTSVAGIAQVHEMKMDGDVMKMRPVPFLELPAGKAVDLAPGGYHVMLMELTRQLNAGDTVPLTLVVEGSDGKRQNVDLQVPVKALSSMPSGGAAMQMKK